MDESGPTPRRRKPLIYTIAVVVAAAIGATAVFLVGSSNRRADRNAVLAYERSILPLVREANKILETEIPVVLEALRKRQETDDRLAQRTSQWERDLERVRKDLLALTPPALLGGVEEGFGVTMGAYLLAVDAVADVGAAAPAERASAIENAATFAERASGFLDDVASIIQFHRQRLGLGTSPDLPEPTATFT